MKKILNRVILFCVALNCCFTANSQNNTSQSDDFKRIAIAPTLRPELNSFPIASLDILLGKMKTMVGLNGLSAVEGINMFVIYPQIAILKSDITATTPAMYSYRLEIIFNIADNYSGNIYATSSQEVVGVGKTQAAAYNAAFQQINERSGKYKVLLEKGKEGILEYYNAHCDLVISKAKSFASQKKYNEALEMLNAVPPVCRECFDKSNAAADEIANKMPVNISKSETTANTSNDKAVSTDMVELENNIILKFEKTTIVGDKVRIHFALINKNTNDFDQHFSNIYETIIVNEKGEEYRIINLKVGATVNRNYLKATLLPDVNTELICEFPKVNEIKLLRFLINENFYRFKNISIINN